jgi:DNA-binding GntR family transcriptional regulator
MNEMLTQEQPLEHKRGATVDYVVRQVLQGILEGRFAPGQRLIARELTETIGISRASVREAFRRMAADGMVELVPNRGAVVRRLSRSEIQEMFEIRGALEGLAARLAAQHIDEGQRRKTFAAVWEHVRPRGDVLAWPEFIDQNRLFHQTIVTIGGNSQLFALIHKLQLPLMMVQVGRAMRAADIARSQQDHIAIADAILAGDAYGADLAMRRHLRSVAEWVLNLPDSAFKPSKASA